MKKSFSTVIAFLLFALMFFKVSSFHAYTHSDSDSDDIENCALCDVAIENQDTDFFIDSTATHLHYHFNTTRYKQPANYDVVVTSTFLRFNFFGRPPPSRV